MTVPARPDRHREHALLVARPVDLVLHLGTGKAGSTTIQFFLRDHRDQLAQQGVLYPRSIGGARHSQVGLFAKPDAELLRSAEWPRQRQRDPAVFRRAFRRRLVAEVDEAGLPRLLLSDEVLFGASPPTLRRLARFTGRLASSVRLVCYLRRQDDHMVSRYQQGIKVGWTARLREWAEEDMTDLYDYRSRLARHRRVFPDATLVVRRFERDAFVGGSLMRDFLDAAALDLPEVELSPQRSDRNVSLDAESVEFLRLLNLHLVEATGAVPGQIDHRATARRLLAAGSGPTLTLPAPFLDHWMEQWAASNSAVARDFVSDPSEALFRAPRRTQGTTTEQRLDPDRLDHFLEVSGVAEQDHAPLRRIAEREARRT